MTTRRRKLERRLLDFFIEANERTSERTSERKNPFFPSQVKAPPTQLKEDARKAKRTKTEMSRSRPKLLLHAIEGKGLLPFPFLSFLEGGAIVTEALTLSLI